MKIAQRHTLFSKRTEIRLMENGIARTQGDKTLKKIHLNEIKSIQLLCDGYSTAHEKVVYKCIVRAPGMRLVFSNALYHDPQAKMDDHYRKIVQKLHDKVNLKSSDTSFIQGSNAYYAMGWFILIFGSLSLAMLPLLLVWALFAGKDLFPLLRRSWIVALLPLAVMGVALPLIRLGKKSEYDSRLLPLDYLP